MRRTLLGITWFNLGTALIGAAGLMSGRMPDLGLPYFATGVAQIVLVLLILGAWPRPLLRRDAGSR